MAAAADAEYTAKEVALHKEATDAWMVIHGEGKTKHPRPAALGCEGTPPANG